MQLLMTQTDNPAMDRRDADPGSLMSLRTEDSVHEVIDFYAKMVYGIALSYVRSPSDADDIYQEVFLTYYQASLIFQSEEHRKAWLIRTTVNRCKKVSGSSWRKKTTPLEEAAGQTDGPGEAFEEEHLVYEAMARLPEKYRVVLYLHYFEDIPTDRIAQHLGLRAGTVRMQLMRGRELMKEQLKGEYFDA